MVWVAPSRLRQRELRFELIDGDDHARAGDSRALDRREADAAASENRDGRSGLDARGVEHGAHPGRDAASDERGAVQRHVVADLHQRVFMHQHLLGVRRKVGKLAHRLALERQPGLFALAPLRRRAVGAAVGMARHAIVAVAAENRETGDDVVAGLHIVDGLAHFLDDSGGFMAQYGGGGKGVVAVDKVQVAVANTARDGAHQDFAIQRLVDLDVFDNQRLLGTIEYGGLHRRSPPQKFCGEPLPRGTAAALAVLLDAALDAASCCFWILPGSIPIRPRGRRRCQADAGATKRRG